MGSGDNEGQGGAVHGVQSALADAPRHARAQPPPPPPPPPGREQGAGAQGCRPERTWNHSTLEIHGKLLL